jgi:RimJ/RimL family protein N-acetyltransferase
MAELMTERLLLRQWRPEDLEPFARLGADPEVMRYFPSTQPRERSDALARDLAHAIEERGWGFWAVEVRSGAPFIGFVGLGDPGFDAHFMPAVEIGWRLAREHWGQGYATEAARAAVEFGFGELGLEEIVAMTVPANSRSRAVMERLGMTWDPADDFDHPRVPPGPLRRHVLYRLAQPATLSSEPAPRPAATPISGRAAAAAGGDPAASRPPPRADRTPGQPG